MRSISIPEWCEEPPRCSAGAESAVFYLLLHTRNPSACPEPSAEPPWAAVHKLQGSILLPAGCAGLAAVQPIDNKDFGGGSVLGQGWGGDVCLEWAVGSMATARPQSGPR